MGYGPAQHGDNGLCHADIFAVGIRDGLGRHLLGALLVEPDALHALIGIVVAQGGVLGENIVERLVAVAVAEAVEHLFAVLLRVNIPVHERLQRGDYLAGIRRGQQASAKQCDDDGQQPRDSAYKAALIAAPRTQGDYRQKDYINDSSHMYQHPFLKVLSTLLLLQIIL